MSDDEQRKLSEAMAAFRARTATVEQLDLIEDALIVATRLFIAMGNEPNSRVMRGLRYRLEGVQRAKRKELG